MGGSGRFDGMPPTAAPQGGLCRLMDGFIDALRPDLRAEKRQEPMNP
jgi:hypothetical protein